MQPGSWSGQHPQAPQHPHGQDYPQSQEYPQTQEYPQSQEHPEAQQYSPKQEYPQTFQQPQYPTDAQQGTTEFWLDSGAALPRREWQHKTRVPVIVGTSIAMVVFAGLAVFAIVLGVNYTPQFTAIGGVPVSCASWETTANGGTISDKTVVTIYSETGGKLATAPLERHSTEQKQKQCVLRFSAKGVDAGKSGYVVHLGDTFAQPVSGSALERGVVFRPTS
ncbi:hypothetical protein [Gordonia sputi]|uniref:hypothetical protein n=1 Tax=Gordonia sputi TaxID=36823 RepID=UPI00367811E8